MISTYDTSPTAFYVGYDLYYEDREDTVEDCHFHEILLYWKKFKIFHILHKNISKNYRFIYKILRCNRKGIGLRLGSCK